MSIRHSERPTPPLPTRITCYWVIVAAILTLAAFIALMAAHRRDSLARIEHLLDSIEVQQEFQGLTLDQTGVGALILAMHGRSSAVAVHRLRVRSLIPGRNQVFEQTLRAPNASVTVPYFSRMTVSSPRLQVEMATRYPASWLAFCMAASTAFSAITTAILAGIHVAQRHRIELGRIRTIEEISAQVSHDIRSPLAALRVVFNEASHLPPEYRKLASNAFGRIEAIFQDLLQASRPDSLNRDEESIQLRKLVEEIVAEKKVLLQPLPGLQLHLTIEPEDQSVLPREQSKELGRVLSNLINNSIEALGERGVIDVQVSRAGDQTEVRVWDNGPGLPRKVLERLGERGNSVGKTGGSGLGLAHAFKTMKAWGGVLKVQSNPDQGTTVRLRFPSMELPATS